MKYNYSEKRKLRDRQQADWSKRLEVFRLINNGVGFTETGKRLGMTKQAVHVMYNKVKKMTLQEVIDLQENFAS